MKGEFQGEKDCRRALSSDGRFVYELMPKHLFTHEYTDIHQRFIFCGELGAGATGIVKRCIDKFTGEVFACKTVLKSRFRCHLDVKDLQNEIETLRIMQGHPSVVQLNVVLEDAASIHLVMELCEGGDLFERIKERKFYPENEAAVVVKSIASALATAHQNGIMHRDIKPENILLASKDSDTDVRVADFGSATKFRAGHKLNQLIGSPLYISPSVLQHSYGPEADLWSLGIVLYVMLCGVPPFWGRTTAEIFHSIQNTPLNLNRGRLKLVSKEAKDLLAILLARDGSGTLTALEILNHPFVALHCGHTPSKYKSRSTQLISRAKSVHVKKQLLSEESAFSSLAKVPRGHRHSLNGFRHADLVAKIDAEVVAQSIANQSPQKSVLHRNLTPFSISSADETDGSNDELREGRQDIVHIVNPKICKYDSKLESRMSSFCGDCSDDEDSDIPIAEAFEGSSEEVKAWLEQASRGIDR